MDGIKTIQTGEITFLAVLVAPDASNFRISKGFPDPPAKDLAYDTKLNVWQTGNAILPPGNWKPLEIASALCEQHLEMLLPGTFAQRRYSHFQDILKAHKCFSQNPYGKSQPLEILHSQGDTGFSLTLFERYVEKWKQAQANTGNWLIVIKTT